MTIWFRFAYPFLLVLLFSFSACMTFTHCSDDKPTQPPDTLKARDTTSHEFDWEVDTIPAGSFFQGNYFYGDNPNDVFLAGISSEPDDMCYRWNGDKWSNYTPMQYWMSSEIKGVDGIDSSFVIFTSTNETNRARLAVIDQGKLVYIQPPQNLRYTTCLRVISRNEIYLGGVDGIQMYDGTEWHWLLDSTKSVIDSYGNQFVPLYIHKPNNQTLEFVSSRNHNPEPAKFYRWRFDGNRFIVVDTFSYMQPDVEKIHFGYSVSRCGNQYFSTGYGGTFQWKSNEWHKIMPTGGIYVAGEDRNVFVSLAWKTILHWNGSTVENIYPQIENINNNIQLIYGIHYANGSLFVSAKSGDHAVVFRGWQKKN